MRWLGPFACAQKCHETGNLSAFHFQPKSKLKRKQKVRSFPKFDSKSSQFQTKPLTEAYFGLNENPFDVFQEPNNQIESLTCEGNLIAPRYSHRKLADLFPELHELALNPALVHDPNIFTAPFPLLKTIKIACPKLSRPFNNEPTPSMERLFKNNPQIKIVVIVGCSPKYRNLATKYLNDLEQFDVIDHPAQTKVTRKRVQFDDDENSIRLFTPDIY